MGKNRDLIPEDRPRVAGSHLAGYWELWNDDQVW